MLMIAVVLGRSYTEALSQRFSRGLMQRMFDGDASGRVKYSSAKVKNC